LELIYLQSNSVWFQSDSVLKEKLNTPKLNDFYASQNEATIPNLGRIAQKRLTLFSSTSVSEKTISVMKNINRSRHSSTLTDQHLGSILRAATTNFTSDIDALYKKRRSTTLFPLKLGDYYYVVKLINF